MRQHLALHSTKTKPASIAAGTGVLRLALRTFARLIRRTTFSQSARIAARNSGMSVSGVRDVRRDLIRGYGPNEDGGNADNHVAAALSATMAATDPA
jgi:hypothetical protein